MVGFAKPCPPFSLGVDCLAPMSASTAKAFAALGVKWVGRYLENLTADEVTGIHAAGLAIALLIEGRTHDLGAALGNQVGMAAATKAMALGVPPGVNMTVDIEETGNAAAADVAAYANEVGAVLKRYGYAGSCYPGAGLPFNAQQLYALALGPYWRGGSLGIPEPACGFAILQLFPLDQVVEGQRVDFSVSQKDFRGRSMTMWWPADPAERETVPEGLPDPPSTGD